MSIELNAYNMKSVAQRVMKAKDMHIRNGFTPVKSSYTLRDKNFDLHEINVSDNEMIVRAFKKTFPNLKEETIQIFRGTIDEVNNKLAEIITKITAK